MKGFQLDKKGIGYDIVKVNGWDYPSLVSAYEKAERLANNGNEFIKKNMTWDVMLPKYIQFYNNILDYD